MTALDPIAIIEWDAKGEQRMAQRRIGFAS